MNVGDRVKVIRNDETMRDNTADRYGHIIVFHGHDNEEAVVVFNDYEAVIKVKNLRVKEGGAG